MRLGRAKVELKLWCNNKLMDMVDAGNYRALMKLLDIIEKRQKEEEKRFNDKAFEFSTPKDFSLEDEGNFYDI